MYSKQRQQLKLTDQRKPNYFSQFTSMSTIWHTSRVASSGKRNKHSSSRNDPMSKCVPTKVDFGRSLSSNAHTGSSGHETNATSEDMHRRQDNGDAASWSVFVSVQSMVPGDVVDVVCPLSSRQQQWTVDDE